MPINLGKPYTFGPFKKGINNVDRGLTMGKDEVVSAVNFDIDREGVMSSRDGYTLSLAAPGAHSLWSRDRDTAFFVCGPDMRIVSADTAGALSESPLRTGVFAAGVPVGYVVVNGVTYYSNGIITGLIRADNTPHPWGVETPSRAPNLAAAAGNLAAGRYQVAIQYIDDLGEFGGLTLPVTIVVPVNSAIVVSGFPTPVSADITKFTLYVSSHNGEELYRYGDYPVGTGSVVVNRTASDGRRATNLISDVMPPCSMLEWYGGRIYGAVKNLIFHTNPLQYGQCLLRTNFIPFPDDITVLKAVDDGLYVGTDSEVVFLGGAGPAEFNLKIALPCGAVRGSAIALEGRKEQGGPTVVFLSERGFVKAGAGGNVQIDEKERVSVGMYAMGATLYRELGDFRQFIATMRGGTRSGIVSTDYAEAEVRRNGQLI